MGRKFTKYPKNYVSASTEPNKIILSKSALEQQFTDTFNQAMGQDSDFNPATELFLRIDINPDDNGILVDIEAETYFDETTSLSYNDYYDLMLEFDQPAMSEAEYYDSKANDTTLVDKMTEVIKAYNPEWYFELYNACRIQAYLDNAVLEA